MKLTRKQIELAVKSLPVYPANSIGVYRIPIQSIDVALHIPMTAFPDKSQEDFIVFHWDDHEQDWTIEVK